MFWLPHRPDRIFTSATLSSTYTACANYGLDSVVGDSAIYSAAIGVDANGHVCESFTDALGNTRYIQADSGLFGQTLPLVTLPAPLRTGATA